MFVRNWMVSLLCIVGALDIYKLTSDQGSTQRPSRDFNASTRGRETALNVHNHVNDSTGAFDLLKRFTD